MPQKVLLAFNDGMLWQLEVFSTSFVSAILDRVVAGDLSTTAKHISENYSLAPTVKMEELVILASHVVMMGAKENPALIGGIEVAIIPKSETPYFLTLEQEQQLHLISQSVDAQIGNLLRQPFDCERVVPPAVAPE